MSSYLEPIGWSYRHETESDFPPLVLFSDSDQGQIPPSRPDLDEPVS